jgi:hypothetical protein
LALDAPVETLQAFLKNINHLQLRFDDNFFRENVIGVLLKNALDKKISNLQVNIINK